MAAVAQIVAAVVSPETPVPLRMMVPVPKKPTPVTIWAATRDGSAVSKPNDETMVKSAAPTATRDSVRIPAGLSALRPLVTHGSAKDCSEKQPDRDLYLFPGGEGEDVFQRKPSLRLVLDHRSGQLQRLYLLSGVACLSEYLVGFRSQHWGGPSDAHGGLG